MSDAPFKFSDVSGRGRGLSRSPFGIHDYGNREAPDYQALEENRLRWEMEQAVAQGDLDADELETIKDRSNFVEKMLGLGTDFDTTRKMLRGFATISGPVAGPTLGAIANTLPEGAPTDGYKNTGSTLETLAHILSIPSYMMAGLSEAGLDAMRRGSKDEEPLPPMDGSPEALRAHLQAQKSTGIGRFAKGFSPTAYVNTFLRSVQNAQEFVRFSERHNVFGSDAANLAGGIIADIGLDPTTYLTFGVSAGAKVSLKHGVHAGKQLTLTRFGTDLYRLAANALQPKLAAELGEGKHLLDGPVGPRLHQEISQYMVDHFDELKATWLQAQRRGVGKRLKQVLGPVSAANRSLMIEGAEKAFGQRAASMLGMSDSALFQETASWAAKERGLYSIPDVQRKLASLKVLNREIGQPLRWLFDTFDKGWDAPPEVVEQVRLTEYAVRELWSQKLHGFNEMLGGLDDAQRSLVSEAVEARAARDLGFEHSLGAVVRHDEAVETAIEFFKKSMDEILEVERKSGFQTGRVEGYVAHIYKFHPSLQELTLDALKKNGQVNPLSGNPFVQQRLIASIADGEELFGKGALETDALKILAMRQKASLNMIHRQELYETIVREQGTPAAIIHSMTQGSSKGLLRGWFRRGAQGVVGVVNVDQVYGESLSKLPALGFREMDPARNRKILEWLMRHPTKETVDGVPGRFSEEGQRLAAELEIPEAAAYFVREKTSTTAAQGVAARGMSEAYSVRSGPLPTHLQVVYSGDEALVVDQGLTKQTQRLKVKVTDTLAALDDAQHPLWVRIKASSDPQRLTMAMYDEADRYLRRYFNAPLEGFRPGASESIRKAFYTHGIEESKTTISKAYARWSASQGVRELVPQLPRAFVDLAKKTREAFGDVTDSLAPSQSQINWLYETSIKLGFDKANFRRFVRLSVGSEDGSVQTARQADILQRALDSFLETPEQQAGKMLLGGEEVVRVKVPIHRKWKNSLLPELLDEDLGLPARVGAKAEAPASGVYRGEVATRAASAAYRQLSNRHAAKLTEIARYQRELADSYTVAKSGDVKQVITLREKNKVLRKQIQEAAKKRAEVLALHPSNKAVDRAARGAALRELRLLRASQQQVSKLLQSKELVEAWASYRALLKNRKPNLRALRTAQREAHKLSKLVERAKTAAPTSDASLTGLAPGGPLVSPPSPRLVQARAMLQAAETPEAKAAALAELEAARRAHAQTLGNTGLRGGKLKPDVDLAEIDVYLPRSIATLLADLETPSLDPRWSEGFKSLVRGYDAVTRIWKGQLMSPHGGFHFRNLLSNASMTMLAHGADLFRPALDHQNARGWTAALTYMLSHATDFADELLVDSAKAKAATESLGKMTLTTRQGRVVSVAEVVHEAKRRGVASGFTSAEVLSNLLGPVAKRAVGAFGGVSAGMTAGAVAGGASALASDQDPAAGVTTGSALGALAGAVLGVRGIKSQKYLRTFKGGIPFPTLDGVTHLLQSNWSPILRRAEHVTETPFRMLSFVSTFLKTGSYAEAASAVYRFQNDWLHLSAVERRYLRRAFPFYTWSKLAVRNTFLNVVEHPGRLGNTLDIFGGFQEIHDVDPEDVPDYYHNKLFMAHEWKSDDGSIQRQVISGIGLPSEDVAEMLAPLLEENKSAFRVLAQRGGFGITQLYEFAVGQDTFTGQAIRNSPNEQSRYESGTEWERAPAWVKWLVGFEAATPDKASGVRPEMAWLLKEVPVGRFLQVANKVYEGTGPDVRFNYRALAREVLGVNAYVFDAQRQKYYANQKRLDRMADLLMQVHRLRPRTVYSDINKEDPTPGSAQNGPFGKKKNPFAR